MYIPTHFDPKSSVSFTGPRDQKLLGSPAFNGDFKSWNKELTQMYQPLADALGKQIDDAISEGKTTFITGCATGVDTIAACVVSKRIEQSNRGDLQLVLAWPKANFNSKNAPWYNLLSTLSWKPYTINIDVAAALDQEAEKYGQNAVLDRKKHTSNRFTFLNDRNLYMLENSGRVIAVWPEGTTAKSKGRIITPTWRAYANAPWQSMSGSGTGNAIRDAQNKGKELDVIRCKADGAISNISVEKNYLPIATQKTLEALKIVASEEAPDTPDYV